LPEQLATINPETPAGFASLIAITSQALQAGLSVGEATRNQELKRAEKAKATKNTRKRDERGTAVDCRQDLLLNVSSKIS
jgi:hypothetical protein